MDLYMLQWSLADSFDVLCDLFSHVLELAYRFGDGLEDVLAKFADVQSASLFGRECTND